MDLDACAYWLNRHRETANTYAEHAGKDYPELAKALDAVATSTRRAQSLAEVLLGQGASDLSAPSPDVDRDGGWPSDA